MNNKFICILLFLILSLIQVELKSQNKKEPTYTQLAASATNELRNGNYANAEILFKKALEKNPAGVDSYYNLGCTYSLWSKILESDEKKTMQNKALDALRQAIAAGYRNIYKLKSDKDLIEIRELTEMKQIIKDMEYIIAGGMTYESAKPLNYKIFFPGENTGIPLSLLVFLMPNKSVFKGEIQPEKFIGNRQYAFMLIVNSEKSKTLTDLPWDEFSYLRIRKTLKNLQSKKNEEYEIDFAKVVLAGVVQSGTVALKTIIKYPNDFNKAVLINTPMFDNSKQLKELSKIKKKEGYEFLVYHSSSDSLAFNASVKNWNKLKKMGFKVTLKTGDFGVNTLNNVKIWKNEINEFATKFHEKTKNDKDK